MPAVSVTRTFSVSLPVRVTPVSDQVFAPTVGPAVDIDVAARRYASNLLLDASTRYDDLPPRAIDELTAGSWFAADSRPKFSNAQFAVNANT